MRRFFDRTKGSVSVFLILTLMPMYTCVYLAVDTARYTAADTKVSGAMDLTGNAALADYDRDLKKLYGIFAMSCDDVMLSEELSAYFSNMIDTAELPLMHDSFVRVILNRVISGIAGGGTGGFENAVYTETAEFSAAYLPESALTSVDVLQAEIRSFMKYRAPLKVAAGTAQNLKAFADASKLAGVFKQITALYSALAPAENALTAVFDTFPATNETNVENVKSGLTSALNALPQLKETLSPISDDVEQVKDAISQLEDGKTKSMLENELDDISGILSTDGLDLLSSALNSDLEKLNSIDTASENAEDFLSQLSYAENPLYKFLLNTYGNSGETISEQNAENVTSNIRQIANSDLGDLYAICKDECAYEVSGMIQHSVWEALYQNNEVLPNSGQEEFVQSSSFDDYSKDFLLLEEFFSDMQTYAEVITQNVYEAEYFTEMFACLTTQDTAENLLGLRYDSRNYLIGEAEYIIFGEDWMADNITKTINTIFAIRLLFNSLYAFSNAEMREDARVLACALSGLNGMGILLNQNLLLLAWSMAESVTDISALCKGNAIPVYKTAKTWNLDIATLSNALTSEVIHKQKDASDTLTMTYKDYLKLFVLMKMCSAEEKTAMIRRTAGVMQINCSQENVLFDISHCYTKTQLKSSVQVGLHIIEKSEVYGY